MSYLNSSNLSLPNLTKATISLWFRIPKATIDAAAKAFEKVIQPDDSESEFIYGVGWSASPGESRDFENQPPMMPGIIPLIVFGARGSSGFQERVDKTYGSYLRTEYFQQPDGVGNVTWELVGPPETHQITATGLGDYTSFYMEPSYIGVWCTDNPPRALLAVNLAMSDHADIKGLTFLDSWEHSDEVFYDYPWTADPSGTEQIPNAPRTVITDTKTFSDFPSDRNIYAPDTECFRVHPRFNDLGRNDGTTEKSPPFGITITPDQWHHVLLSFDLTDHCKTHGTLQTLPPYSGTPSKQTDSAPKMWIAYDDENKTGRDLSYYWIGKGGLSEDFEGPDQPDDANADPNKILSPQAWRVAATLWVDQSKTYDDGAGHDITLAENGLSEPTYDYTPTAIPVKGEPMGIPASADWVDNIHNVEMAEFQMWIGLALDTGIETNRRAFVDKDGKPVSPNKEASNADHQSGSIELLGREPDILLHGSGNWIKGKNTGSIGIDADGHLIPAGQFTPTAKIVSYKPDPSLNT